MKLPKYAIENYQFTLMAFLLLTLAGVFSFFTMPRTENPTVYIPGGSVVVIYPGSSPNDLEKLIAIPIEESINELENIKQMNTTIKDGIVSIAVEFNFNTDAKEKYDEMVSKVNSVKSQLPEDIYSLETYRWTSSDVSVIQLAMVSDTAEYYVLEDYAQQLKENIEKTEGIRKVSILAFPEREVLVSFDMEKMVHMNITIDQVMNAIHSNNANIPGGSIELGNSAFSIKTTGSYENLDEIRNTVIQSYNGRLIYLRNIATVDYGYKDPDYIARFNGRRAIFIAIQQKENLNLFDIVKSLYPEIQEFDRQLPENIELHYVFDQSVFVKERINGFLRNLLQGIFLVGFIIFISLGFKSSLIVIITIPLSIITGLWVVDISGYGLQQISIAGLVVALGLLVDNSIVMIENINRFMSMGYSRKEAAIKGANEIALPVISATATTILAFVPLIMMPDKAGDFIKSLPITIIATLSLSLVIALTITPLAASRIIKKQEKPKSFGFSKLLNKFIEGPYRKLLALVLKKRAITLSLTFVVLLISLFAFRFVGISFFPKAELPQFLIRIELPEGKNLVKTETLTLKVEKMLDTIPEILHYAINIGHGNPRIYYNVMPKNYNKNFAEIYVRLKEYELEKFDKLVANLRVKFASIPGAKITIKEFEQGIPITAPIEVNILGDNIDVLQEISTDIEDVLNNSNGVINVENLLNRKKTDIVFTINKEKAAMLGIPIYEIDKTVRTCINGMEISKFRNSEGKEYAITMRLSFNNKLALKDFDRIYVRSLSGNQIPLKQVASVDFKETHGILTRLNLKKNATIIADIKKGYNLDDVLQPIAEHLNIYNFPSGYSYEIAGELENRQESYGGMTNAIIIAIIAIFAVLVLQFKSFSQPWIIFVSVPLAFIGSVWAWLITKNSFSFTAFVGLISLVGIVVNNSIILVDYTNKLIASGNKKTQALQIAGETRFTPIILTSLTTIGGLLPLTLGGGTLWAPMGWGIIGGLITSTALTLFIVPVLYHLLTPEKE
ncbi:MAG: efflux RND transporter permease subunit [Bacteroidales bacterium]|nr:efflux RND transporter permease subunit [Bacteroidales bacterium]